VIAAAVLAVSIVAFILGISPVRLVDTGAGGFVSPQGNAHGVLPTALSKPTPAADPTLAAAADLIQTKEAPVAAAQRLPAPQPAPARPAAAPSAPLAGLPTGELGALVARGDDLIRNGDIVSARLFYERAAAAGDGKAALRIGQTFDPAFIGSTGRYADTVEAAAWYRRARDFGEPEAASRLDRLAPE
jgi:TPR repeat protein